MRFRARVAKLFRDIVVRINICDFARSSWMYDIASVDMACYVVIND